MAWLGIDCSADKQRYKQGCCWASFVAGTWHKTHQLLSMTEHPGLPCRSQSLATFFHKRAQHPCFVSTKLSAMHMMRLLVSHGHLHMWIASVPFSSADTSCQSCGSTRKHGVWLHSPAQSTGTFQAGLDGLMMILLTLIKPPFLGLV